MTNQHAARVLAFFLLIILLINLGWACAASNLPRAHADSPASPVLVKVKPSTTPPPGAAGTPFLTTPTGDWYTVRPPSGKSAVDAVNDLKGRPDVLDAAQNATLTTQDEPRPEIGDVYDGSPDGEIQKRLDQWRKQGQPLLPLSNDPLYSQQYSLPNMGAPSAWPVTDGSAATVYVLDTGGDFSHPDLRLVPGPDYVQGDTDPSDYQGHGTHVAGIVAAIRDNGIGVAGVSKARVVVVRVLGNDGSGYTDAIARGIQWAADQPGDRKIISMSLGGGGENAPLRDAIAYARGRNTLVVAAAGNSNTNQVTSPAIYADLKVCAVAANNTRAPFSNWGVNINICAPGVDVVSTVMRAGPAIYDPSGYKALSGTSMATPNVSGVAALAWSAHPSYTALQIRDLLLNTATPLGDSTYYGRGLVNAARAVGATTPPPGATPTARPPIPTATPNPATAWGRRVYDLVNQQRVQNGLRALPWSDTLARAARAHNLTMDSANCFAHQCPGELDPNARAKSAGWTGLYVLEDIARGYMTPEDVVLDGWMNSAGHRAAILSDRATEIGADFLDGASGNYLGMWWTLEMGVGSTPAPAPTARPTPLPQPPAGYVALMTLDYDTARATTVDDAYWTFHRYEAYPCQYVCWTRTRPNADDPTRTPAGLLPGGWMMTVRLPASAGADAWDALNRFYNVTHRGEPGLWATVWAGR